jgi:D-lactate dehydrogenase
MLVAVFDTKSYDRPQLLQHSVGSPLEWRFHEFRLTAQTAATAAGADAVCVFVNDQLDRACLEILAAHSIRHIALRCTGFNNVDLPAAKELGLVITRVPDYSPYAVAEHAVALLLTLNRKIHRAYNRVREQNFSLNGLVGFDLHGKTASILGTGKIGRITAQILRGIGMRVLANDPYPDFPWAEQYGVEYVNSERLFTECDVLSLHVPLTPETRYTVNEQTLASMRSGSILINVSRGALIDSKALIQVLKEGKLSGVALDVYEEEEGIFFEDLSGEVLHDDDLSRLITFPNVLITSHQAFLTREALSDIARTTVANLLATHSGTEYTRNAHLA